MCTVLHAHLSVGVHRGQTRVADHLELELQGVVSPLVCVLET